MHERLKSHTWRSDGIRTTHAGYIDWWATPLVWTSEEELRRGVQILIHEKMKD